MQFFDNISAYVLHKFYNRYNKRFLALTKFIKMSMRFNYYSLISIALFLMSNHPLDAQVNAGLFRFPDVSSTQIVFSYANDLWLVPKQGGNALKISSPVGMEVFPKFSPDGQKIAFSANYDGNADVYLQSIMGGVPTRLTQHGKSDRMVDWHPDGQHILFASNRESEKDRFNQLFTISIQGGFPTKLPFAYGEFGSYSSDGQQMAMVIKSEIFRTWKRYRGGDVADIYLFNLKDSSSQNISTSIDASEELPMWHENNIYFLSDNGPEKRMNLWKYDLKLKSRTQLTMFKDDDIHFPSQGPEDIVFEASGKLYLYSLKSNQLTEVKVNIITDKIRLKTSLENVDKLIEFAAISPDGNRALIEARGEIFSLPAENGSVINLTQSSGSAQRFPKWSPDGKTIAYWSDQSGEYELWTMNATDPSSKKKMTNYGPGYRYQLFWSPDSKKLAFIDQSMQIKIFDITTGASINVDKGLRMTHGSLMGFNPSWSPDSRWLTYNRDLENYHNAVFVFDVNQQKLHQITSGYYECSSPVFDSEGKYIYLFTNQLFQPSYSDIDNTFIYTNSTQIAAISLLKKTPSLLSPKNDTVVIKSEPETIAKAKEAKNKKVKENKEKKDTTAPKITPVEIDFDQIESRMVVLPIPNGNFGNIASSTGKIIYLKVPNTGSPNSAKMSIAYYDIEKREEKNILDDANGFILSADGKKMLAFKGEAMTIIKPEENQKWEKPLRIAEMSMMVDPAQEWKQILTDVWRLERDFFYDGQMHGVNWNLIKERYLKMLEVSTTREDVNFIIGEMIAELNASHTYRGGGPEERAAQKNVGYLGINWESEGQFYKIKNIIKPGSWDAEIKSPLAAPGLVIKEGDYILAVNGIPLSTQLEPTASFQGLGNKTVELTYNTSPSWTNAKKIMVQTIDNEARLRHLAWIESKRKRVEEASNGTVGYIYVPSTGTDGQSELIRQFSAQWDKKALIIDERFNNGGQIPDRFVEILNREPLAFFATRDGQPWPWPPYAHFGPKVMLINGWSGSGGDAFPDYFRKKHLGPLIGTRTWGGLIGISGVPSLIDGGSITAPSFRMYNSDGTWFKEGHGVDPDIEVMEDLTALSKGIDNQLERAIIETKELIKKKEFVRPQRPPAEVR